MRSALVAMLLTILTAASALACQPARVSGAQATIDPRAIDQALFDAAVAAETNAHRCRAGLGALEVEARLRRAAATHSDWMARTGQLTHVSTVSGQRTVPERIQSSNVRIRGGAENIGYVPRMNFPEPRFRIVDGARCAFRSNAGADVAPHSYASLARKIVDEWMASPSHRRNILNRGMTRVSHAVAFDGRSPHCGRYYVTQHFVQ
ncbi:MAG: CAP domain-containing protein [Rhodobacteraceae bacterium]|jgi:uncharacterized protein YkwD|nr:CAP domain-containing protein [Paracoccaceae bacterium]